jgi:phosphotransferase system enzyme I (PtsI)
MTRSRERIFRGSPVSHGFAQGKVFVYKPYLPELTEHILRPSAVDSEVQRFDRAVRAAQRDLRKLHSRVKKEMGRDFAEFVGVQLALLADEEILGQTRRFIRKRARNAEFAYAETLKHLTRQIAASEVALFKERALDVVDVGSRVLQHLLGDEFPSLHTLVLEGGGRTSHTALMAKAKEIPAVVGVDSVTRYAHDGQILFVDGYRGLAILNPTRKRLRAYEDDIARYHRHQQSLSRLAAAEPVTADGRVIDLSANIEFLAEAETALKHGAKGIGLFRTEYMYIARQRPPTEDEQFEVFARVARLLDPLPVIIRTFDLGGDKVIPGYTESNPFLGWRGLRLCFDNPGLFRGQLRAILRASAFGNVKIMFPMVSAIEELRRAKQLVEEAKDELKRARVKYDGQIDVGVMVETPAAALMADDVNRLQRPDPVHAGGGPGERARGRAVRPVPSRGPAPDQAYDRCRSPAGGVGRVVWRVRLRPAGDCGSARAED